MEFLKKKLDYKDKIYSKNIEDKKTKTVTEFYKNNPFPNYKKDDNKASILSKGQKNYLVSRLKDAIGYNKNILEVGCGTGQLSIYFSIGTNNRVIGFDPTLESLKLASNFAKKNNIHNVEFINADIYDDVLSENCFDLICCNGVLHHTKDPYGAFKIMIKSLKKGGYVLIGLYNKMGRIRTILRKYMSKIFGAKYLEFFDPTLRNLKVSKEERNAWIKDQYYHPIESLHTMDEVLNWFKDNQIEFINSIPSCDFDESYNDNILLKKSKGNLFSRIVNQVFMIFDKIGSDGGLFIMIGKKNG